MPEKPDSTNPSAGNEFDRACGHRLRVTRLVLGISEQDAADAFGRSLRTYQGYEAGRRERGQGYLSFARKYGVSLDWLCGGDAGHIGNHLSRRSGTKVAILPVQKRQTRHSHLAHDIARLLPRDKVDALAVLEHVRDIVEFAREPDPAPVVELA
jgi:transcriptional regulator with XRE-family HTH domain